MAGHRRLFVGSILVAIAVSVIGGWLLSRGGDTDGIAADDIVLAKPGTSQIPSIGTNAPVQGTLLPVVDLSTNDGATVATADLTLCIGLGLAFVIFLVVIFVIIKILRRKGGPYPNYGLGPEGKILFSSDSNLSEYLYVCRYMYVCICFMCRYLPRYFLLVSVGIPV